MTLNQDGSGCCRQRNLARTGHETKLKAAQLKVLDTPHAREQEVNLAAPMLFMTDFPYTQRMLKTTDWARVIKPKQNITLPLRLRDASGR